jgi:hypothetical protein
MQPTAPMGQTKWDESFRFKVPAERPPRRDLRGFEDSDESSSEVSSPVQQNSEEINAENGREAGEPSENGEAENVLRRCLRDSDDK